MVSFLLLVLIAGSASLGVYLSRLAIDAVFRIAEYTRPFIR